MSEFSIGMELLDEVDITIRVMVSALIVCMYITAFAIYVAIRKSSHLKELSIRKVLDELDKTIMYNGMVLIESTIRNEKIISDIKNRGVNLKVENVKLLQEFAASSERDKLWVACMVNEYSNYTLYIELIYKSIVDDRAIDADEWDIVMAKTVRFSSMLKYRRVTFDYDDHRESLRKIFLHYGFDNPLYKRAEELIYKMR